MMRYCSMCGKAFEGSGKICSECQNSTYYHPDSIENAAELQAQQNPEAVREVAVWTCETQWQADLAIDLLRKANISARAVPNKLLDFLPGWDMMPIAGFRILAREDVREQATDLLGAYLGTGESDLDIGEDFDSSHDDDPDAAGTQHQTEAGFPAWLIGLLAIILALTIFLIGRYAQ